MWIEKETSIKKMPPVPFITSTLQQAASNKYNMAPKLLMIIAQKLYQSGKITYMRTDNPNLSIECSEKIKKYILNRFGENFLGQSAYIHKSKKYAHECIRPTNIQLTQLSNEFSPQERNIYKMDAEFHFQQQVIPMLEQLGDRDFITDTEQAVKNRRARRIKSGMRVDIDATGEVLVPDTDNKDLPTIREYNRNKQSMSDLQAVTHQSVLDQIEMIAATTSTSVNNTQYNTTKSPESTFDSYDQYDMPNVDVA